MVSISQVSVTSRVAPVVGAVASDDAGPVISTVTPASPTFDARPPALAASTAAVVLQEQNRVDSPAPTRVATPTVQGKHPSTKHVGHGASAGAHIKTTLLAAAIRRDTDGDGGAQTRSATRSA